jgi:predicted DNA-binding transcriptional regulator YafY
VRYEGKAAIVRRLAMLLLYTNRRRYMPSPRVIARGLNVSVRTVIRDLNALQEAGWPMPRRYHE